MDDASQAALGPGLLLFPPFGWIFAVLFGALWGSFWNVAIHRLALDGARLRDVVYPPSHCPRCQHPVRGFDNIPVLSWLILRGRCRDCALPISPRYPLVELLGAITGGVIYWAFVLPLVREGLPAAALAGLGGRFLAYFFFVSTLLVLALIDLDTMLLPEVITFPAIPSFFLVGQLVGDVPLVEAAIGAAVGFGALKGLQLGYAAATGREGLGGGDATLMALIGGFLGWKSLPFTLGLGATLGTAVSVPLLLWQRSRGKSHAPERQSDIAAQHADSAVISTEDAAMQQEEVAMQQGVEEPTSLRHVEVPFGPFLVAGALAYMFGRDYFWMLLVGYADRP